MAMASNTAWMREFEALDGFPAIELVQYGRL